ncbi:Aryl-alcohol dehydrogenase [Colletotrichum sp. SAR11_240]|nr:Aryl-alcohol dehydrogenase [Colletotrichum sp. SAR11_240]
MSNASTTHRISIDVGLGDGEHRDAFTRALWNVLATEIAEITFAQIIDGLPLAEVAQDSGNGSLPNGHPIHDLHQQLCPGVIQKTHEFRDKFDPGTIQIDSKLINEFRAASLGSRAFKVRLIELVAVAVHQIAVQIFKLDTSLHKEDGIASWKPPKDDLFWDFYPEGSGYVVNVGKSVTHVKSGDPVLLSFSYCGSCHVCKTGPPSHCTNFFEINFMGEPVFSDGIGGRFFGQSSLAHHTVVSDKSVVNVAGLGLSRDDLRILAPLGCGLQTGSGTVINVAKAGPEDCVTIAGMGGVGLAAVIAAKNQGCKAIIGIDRLESRLELAKSLGATHVINTTGLDMKQVTEKIKEAAEGLGSTISIDTSAYPPLLAAQIDGTRYMGKIIQVGTGMPESNISIHMQTFMVSGKQYFGAVQGHPLIESVSVGAKLLHVAVLASAHEHTGVVRVEFGRTSAALVRDATKLREMLISYDVPESVIDTNLAIVEGPSSRSVHSCAELLRHDPEIIFSGITALPKLQLNPFKPVSMQDLTITGDSAAAVIDALRQLKNAGAIKNSPVFVPISSTGQGIKRDQPLVMVPLYIWLLRVPQADTTAMEKTIKKCAIEPGSPLGGKELRASGWAGPLRMLA